MVVVDASVIVDIVSGSARAPAVAQRLAAERLAAPHLIDEEVVNALRRHALRAETDATPSHHALGYFAGLRIHRMSTELLLDRMWELRNRLSGYDAAYVALAEALDVPLITTDARLGRGHGTDVTVEVIA